MVLGFGGVGGGRGGGGGGGCSSGLRGEGKVVLEKGGQRADNKVEKTHVLGLGLLLAQFFL